MTLVTNTTARISNQRLVELTNPKDRAATGVDAAILALAATDTEAEWQVHAGVLYDDTDAVHVAACVHGVIYYLLTYKGLFTDEWTQAETRWQTMLTNAARTLGRNKISPTTNSVLVPSSEKIGNETVKPDFDRRNFGDYVPGPPGRGPNFGDLTSREDI